MCLGIPSKIVEIDGSKATIDVYGAQRDISLFVLEEDVKIGDYVIVHAGFAIQKLQEDVAKETLGYFNQYLKVEKAKKTIHKEHKENKDF
jgi:hydrogenase expression/formation protein HypC